KAMALFASSCDVSHYVAVDRFCGWGRSYAEDLKNKGVVDAHFYHEDMLQFLAEQDSNSANVWMAGIDDTILRSREYRNELVQQIAR
ncbi:MAG: hypothetical protein AABX82_04380, partial [Nanoarchaeota archaeon]